jgi:hypothetical protein|nr:MAG TPA: hypothetical protein [Caudoviricetes sp.]
MSATKEERLKEIDEAISTILKGGQSYRIGSRTLTRADLNTLRNLRKELLAESDTVSDLFDNAFVAFFDRR